MGIIRYLQLDAKYEKARQNGHIQDAAVLIASGVGEDGKRAILGVSVSLGEHEVHYPKGMLRDGELFYNLLWREAYAVLN